MLWTWLYHIEQEEKYRISYVYMLQFSGALNLLSRELLGDRNYLLVAKDMHFW